MNFLIDPIWFSPLNVILHFTQLSNKLSSTQKKSKEFRKAVEANAVALMLVGLMSKEGKQYWMQIVDDKEQSPDVRTICFSENSSDKFDNYQYQDVEVVEYESHSNMSISEFLLDTKFKIGKGYDKDTHILCHLGGGVKLDISDELDLRKQMLNINSACPVAIVVSDNKDLNMYRLIQLNPEVRVISDFNLTEELHKLLGNNYVGVMNFIRGSKRPLEFRPNEKHYPFESLSFK